jgi:hypothetical protein
LGLHCTYHGKYFDIPKSIINPKPVQKPHPPIYLAVYAPGSLRRAATVSVGWNPVFLPLDAMQQMLGAVKGMAREAGRDPADVQFIVRVNYHLTPQPLGDDRFIYYGTREQIKADIDATRALGADEMFFDPTFSPLGETVEGYLAELEEMKKLA